MCPTRNYVFSILFQQVFCSLSAPDSTTTVSTQARLSLKRKQVYLEPVKSRFESQQHHFVTMKTQIPFLTSLNASLTVCKMGILKPITVDSMMIRDNEYAT